MISRDNFTYYINENTKKLCLSISFDNFKTSTILKDDFYYVSDVENYIINYIRNYIIKEIIQK